jgi:hypothetical protein
LFGEEVLLAAVQLFLSVVLIIAACSKLLYAETLDEALRLTHIPTAAIRPVALAISFVELTLAGVLVVARAGLLITAFVAVCIVFALFIGWMVAMLATGRKTRCGCFGTRGEEIGPGSIARNGVLLLTALGGLMLARTTKTVLPAPSPWLILTALPCVLAIALCITASNTIPHLVLTKTGLRQMDARQEAS